MRITDVVPVADSMRLADIVTDGTVDTESARYAQGIKTGEDCAYVTIAHNNVWSASTREGGLMTSSEKIGYHAGSVNFIGGVIDSGCKVYVYRRGDARMHRLYR